MSGTRREKSTSYGATAIASSPWIVVSVGVGVMVVLLVIALGAYRGRGPAFDAQPGPPEPTGVLPEPRPSPSSPATATSPSRRLAPAPSGRVTSRSTTDRPTPDRTSRTPTPSAAGTGDAALVAPPPSASPTTGRYRVVEEFRHAFVGEVLVSNASSTSREWTARLAFPGGRLVDAWLEGAPQGTVTRTDGGFTYRSGQDLAGGASVALRFYVERADSSPTSCTVDGSACRGL